MADAARSKSLPYLVALVSVGLAFLMSWLLRPWILPSPSPFFTAAVVVTAWYGGLAPALVSAVLAAAARQVLFLGPGGSSAFRADDVVHIGTFLLVACLIGALFRRVEQQREWFEVTLGSIGDAVVTVDTAGRVRFMNAVAETITGWARHEAFGRPVEEVLKLISEKTGQAAENPVLQALREGRAVTLAAHTALVSKNNQEIPIEDSAAPIFDARGKMLGVVMVFRDVSKKRLVEKERERLEQALLAAKAGLEHQVGERTRELTTANRQLVEAIAEQRRAEEERQRLEDIAQSRERLALIGELAAGVAHELRNPLQGVMSYVQVVKMSGGDQEEMKLSLQQIEDGLAQMDRVATRLLDLSRRDAGPTAALDLEPIVEEACAFLRVRAAKQNISLTHHSAPGLPRVQANHGQVVGVLLNLLKNSFDACQKGGTVSIETRPHPKLAGMVEVLVLDTGTGIPDSIRERVFDPFFTTKPIGEGTGLGLPMVKRTVEGYGGYVTIADAGPSGTAISVALPLATAKNNKELEPNGEVVA
ncbi:MAG: ATP-binding protein [Planctomycetota bacterium]